MSVLQDKKTGRLFIKFKFNGVVYKKRLPDTMGKRDGEKLETKWKNDLFFESNGIVPKKEILYEEFLVFHYLPFAEKSHSEMSYLKDVHICNESLSFFKGKTMRRITVGDVEKFKEHRAGVPVMKTGGVRKPATVEREMAVISKIFSLAVRDEYLESNPCAKVGKLVFDNTVNKVLLEQDEDGFFAAFKTDWSRDVCRFVLNTGLRQNDALGLSKFSVDWNRNLIRLIQGKTQRVVEIPMNETVRAILSARQHNGSDLFFPSPRTKKRAKSVKRSCILASERAKIGRITVRDLRRTFATRIGEMNYSVNVTSKLLGHTDTRMAHRYVRVSEILRDAVSDLENGKCAKSEPAPTRETRLVTINS